MNCHYVLLSLKDESSVEHWLQVEYEALMDPSAGVRGGGGDNKGLCSVWIGAADVSCVGEVVANCGLS